MLQMYAHSNPFRLDLDLTIIDDKKCLEQLIAKFPGSPRVEILAGIRMEASEAPATVLQYYDELLENDSANGVSSKQPESCVHRD